MSVLPDPKSDDFIAFLRDLAQVPLPEPTPGTARDYPLDAEIK